MKAVTIKGYVYAEKSRIDDVIRTYVVPYPPTPKTTRTWGVFLGEIEHEYALPLEVDFEGERTRQRIAALSEEREEAGRRFAAEVKRIDDELRKLTAIEHQPEAA